MHILSIKRTVLGATALTVAGLLGFGITVSAQSHPGTIYDTDLSGTKEVPAVSSGVTGHSGVWMDKHLEHTNYWLDVFNATSTISAHLHCAPEGENGPVVAGLFENSAGVTANGRLAEGYLSNSSIANTGEECEDTVGYGIYNLEDLIEAIKQGDIYVNVHTKNYPAGAARGQLMLNEDRQDNDPPKDKGKKDKHDRDKDKHKNHKDKKAGNKHKDDNRNDYDKKDRKDDRHDAHDKDTKRVKNAHQNNKQDNKKEHTDNSKRSLDIRSTINNLKTKVLGGLLR